MICLSDTFDPNSQRWCGPEIDKNILEKKFKNHLCCGHKQFNSQTQSCSDNLQVENLTNNDNKNTGQPQDFVSTCYFIGSR